MDEDTEKRLSELDKRLSAADKRFDDWKGYVGAGATLITVWFAVLTIVLSWNYTSEKASLRDFQHDLREDLGKSVLSPELELQGTDGKPLAGQDMLAEFTISKDKSREGHDESQPVHQVGFRHIIKNSGRASTGPMTAKFYTRVPLELMDKSTDEPQYQFEGMAGPHDLDPNEIPGQLSSPWELWWDLPKNDWPRAERYPCLLKIYYGNGKVVQAAFNLVVLNERVPK
jgi:hypothetical protein